MTHEIEPTTKTRDSRKELRSELRSTLQSVTSALNGARSGGPVTPQGKSVSSLNRVKFGLSSSYLVLPGEDPAAFEDFVRGWFDDLAPGSLPEASLVVQAADLAWRLQRLDRIEHGRLLALVEEELMRSPLVASIAALKNAVRAVRLLLEVLVNQQPPVGWPRFNALESWVKQIEIVVGAVPAIDAGVSASVSAILQVLDDVEFKPVVPPTEATAPESDDHKEVILRPGAWERAGAKAQNVLAHLEERLAREESEVGAYREAIAAQVLLDDSELKKLERSRRMLQNALAKQLDILNSVRHQVAEARPAGAEQVDELRVKLRLLK